jgi:uncharacterized membrane-anchored protein
MLQDVPKNSVLSEDMSLTYQKGHIIYSQFMIMVTATYFITKIHNILVYSVEKCSPSFYLYLVIKNT